MKCILPPWPAGVEINPIWPRSDLDKVVIAEQPVKSVSDILLFLITLSSEYKTKHFVLRRLDEVKYALRLMKPRARDLKESAKKLKE